MIYIVIIGIMLTIVACLVWDVTQDYNEQQRTIDAWMAQHQKEAKND